MIGNTSVYQVKTGGGPYNLASIRTGTGAPGSVTPNFIGQIYVDTSDPGIAYIAVGTTSADWKRISNV